METGYSDELYQERWTEGDDDRINYAMKWFQLAEPYVRDRYDVTDIHSTEDAVGIAKQVLDKKMGVDSIVETPNGFFYMAHRFRKPRSRGSVDFTLRRTEYNKLRRWDDIKLNDYIFGVTGDQEFKCLCFVNIQRMMDLIGRGLLSPDGMNTNGDDGNHFCFFDMKKLTDKGCVDWVKGSPQDL